MNTGMNQKVIKPKVGLIKLAQQLGSNLAPKKRIR
jgi:hypothetical protein